MKRDETDRSDLIAFQDLPFLTRDELRPVRLLLEHLKPDLLQREAGITSTIVVFGSARILEPAEAKAQLETAQRSNGDVELAKRRVELSKYYDIAREFSRIVSQACQIAGRCDYVIVTGGGPGIMEAANRGAQDVGAKSVGLNIVLPHEQTPNRFITRGLGFTFHYFAMRKMHFMLRAKALVVLPGGFGTIDELFEALTLVQTKKIEHLPVILVGREYWEKVFNLQYLLDEGMIAPEDLRLFRYAETAEEAWRHIVDYYAKHGPA